MGYEDKRSNHNPFYREDTKEEFQKMAFFFAISAPSR